MLVVWWIRKKTRALVDHNLVVEELVKQASRVVETLQVVALHSVVCGLHLPLHGFASICFMCLRNSCTIKSSK